MADPAASGHPVMTPPPPPQASPFYFFLPGGFVRQPRKSRLVSLPSTVYPWFSPRAHEREEAINLCPFPRSIDSSSTKVSSLLAKPAINLFHPSQLRETRVDYFRIEIGNNISKILFPEKPCEIWIHWNITNTTVFALWLVLNARQTN